MNKLASLFSSSRFVFRRFHDRQSDYKLSYELIYKLRSRFNFENKLSARLRQKSKNRKKERQRALPPVRSNEAIKRIAKCGENIAENLLHVGWPAEDRYLHRLNVRTDVESFAHLINVFFFCQTDNVNLCISQRLTAEFPQDEAQRNAHITRKTELSLFVSFGNAKTFAIFRLQFIFMM